MGIHSIDTLRFLLGERRPTKVSAWIGTHLEDIDVEDTATVVVEFEGGVVGIIEAGWFHLYADGLEGYSQVYGSKGYARALPSEWHTRIEGVRSIVRPEMPARQQQCDLPMYQAQMDHFLESILNNSKPSPGAEEGIWAMRVLEAAYQSAKLGEAVHV
jgi:predicted dehydrogenase